MKVYNKFFSSRGKKMFREAIGDVLSGQINKPELSMEACKDLIYLISRINAEESLDSLVAFAGEAKPQDENLYSTIAVLNDFKPSKKVYEVTEKLANSSNFNEGYLFEVIGLLVESQPSNTQDILGRFEERTKKLWNSLQDIVEEKNAFLEAKDDCFERVSRIADVTQYKSFFDNL